MLIEYHGVTPDYFAVLGVPILAGRNFTETEIRNAEPVALVTASLVSLAWPGQDPIGQQFRQLHHTFTVIGIVADADYHYLMNVRSPEAKWARVAARWRTVYLPETYVIGGPLDDGTFSSILPSVILVRGPVALRDLENIARDRAPDATPTASTMQADLADLVQMERFQTSVLGSFGAVALFLAMIGVYSVVAGAVARRTRECGIRMALGAKPSEIFLSTCRQGLIPSLLGMLIGFALALAARRMMEAYLYVIRPDDAPTYILMSAVMFVSVLIACVIPARRAAHLDPASALRSE